MVQKKKYKLGIVGTGRLSSSLLKAWLDTKVLKKEQLWAATRRKSSSDKLSKKFKIKATPQYQAYVKDTDIIILGVKPYQLGEICSELKASGLSEKSIVVSLAAGVGTQKIESFLGTKNPVILAMTNTPSQVAEGMTAFIRGKKAKLADVAKLERYFSHSGKTVRLKEEKFHEFTALAASSPAFVFYFMKCFFDSGKKMGLRDKELRLMISQAFLGSAKLFQESRLGPDELIQEVTTPGGCTAEGVSVLAQSELLTLIYKTLDKTREKSKLMAKS